MTLAGVLVGVMLLTGCSDDATTTEPSEAETGVPLATAERDQAVAPGSCEQVFAEAADAGSDALDTAFTACEDTDAFIAAAEQYPDALVGEDAEAYLTSRCAEAELASSPVCSTSP